MSEYLFFSERKTGGRNLNAEGGKLVGETWTQRVKIDKEHIEQFSLEKGSLHRSDRLVEVYFHQYENLMDR